MQCEHAHTIHNRKNQFISKAKNKSKPAGYNEVHSGRLITVFSASNFGGHSYNCGAVLHYQRDSFPLHEGKTFSAPSLEDIAGFLKKGKSETADWTAEAELGNKSQQLEEAWWREELAKLMVAIVESKPAIRSTFMNMFAGKPLVSYDDWKSCLAAAVGEAWHLDLAWQTWRLEESSHGSEHLVNFTDFLQRFKVIVNQDKYTSFKFNAIARVFDAVLHEHASLQETLKRFDQTGCGNIDMNNMRKALQLFDLGLSEAQLDSLLHVFFSGGGTK